MQTKIHFLLTVILLYIQCTKSAIYSEDYVDPDFILRSDLMPSSLLLIDSAEEKVIFPNSSYNSKETMRQNGLESFNGSWYDAYNTMKFHRKMFNEYLCRNFVVKEIFSELQTPILSRRVGRPFVKFTDKEKAKNHSEKRKSRTDHGTVNDDLLSDPGSSNYRNWLSKTTTLEDVYRHYDMAVQREPDASERDDTGDYETGEFTGYAEPSTPNAAGKNDFHQSDNYYNHFVPSPIYPSPDSQNIDTEKHGDDFDFTPHHVHFHSSENEKSNSHGMVLNDLFDVALTAIAFLSFGMFILQVIMCITMNKPIMAMMPMTDVDPDAGEVIDELRFRRQAVKETHPFNELAKRILISIEAGLSADEDKGSCLKQSLCENNKYSRSLKNNQKFWIPVWGLGMSWLSSRFIQGSHTTSIMLESLRACALGLAQIDCTFMYSDCEMRHLLESRKNKTQKWKTSTSRDNRSKFY